MKKVNVYYYIDPQGENPISEFLDSLSKQQQSNILRILSYIQIYGLTTAIPHLKKVTGTPFWEIRILGKDNIRVIYVSIYQTDILLLHGFVKKKQKTPTRDIELALSRYQDWIKRTNT